MASAQQIRIALFKHNWLVSLLLSLSAASSMAADITWTATTTFDNGNLDLSGNVIQAINFSANPQTVTIGGNTVTFASSNTIANGGFTSGPNETAAGVPAYANVLGNEPLGNVLASHSWSSPAGTIHPVTLGGLFSGNMYEIQAFMSDTRTVNGPQTLAFGDNGVLDTALVARNSGTIGIGTFTADGPTQTFLVGGGTGDAALSGYVLRSFSPGNLTATLNRNTGNLSLSNTTASAIDLLGYSVTSAAGALSQTSWLTIANNYDRPSAPTPGNGSIDANDAWNILSGPASNADLSEAELQGGNGGAIGAGQTLNLGNVWIKNPAEDLVVKLLRTDGTVFPVSVSYSGNGGAAFAEGDLNFNGALDPADWAIYIANGLANVADLSQAERYQRGDFNDDGVNNLNDMDIFRDAYDDANGAGAFAAMVASVPEPGGAMLLLGGTLAIALRRPGKRTAPDVLAAAIVLIACLVAKPSIAQLTYNPLATTGHDADIIFENDGSPEQNEEIGSRWFFETGLLTSAGNEIGLPAAPSRSLSYTATTGNTINYAFNDYAANNVLMFESGDPASTLTLAAPSAYGNLAVVFSGGSLGSDIANLGYTINYAGGTTQTGVIDTPDWGAATLPAGVERLFVADRANTGPVLDGSRASATRWAIFVSEIALNNTSLNVESVTFGSTLTLNGGPGGLNSGDDVVVFGLAGPGEVIPTKLNLEVNPNGQVRITNPTDLNFDINGYEILSEAGSLSTAGWTVPSGWDKGGESSANGLIAGSLSTSAMIGPDDFLSLGTAYSGGSTASNQDLEFRYRTTDGTLVPGTVEYLTGGTPADFDGDGDVDGNDLNVWKNNFGSSTATATTGDADGDADVDGRDFLTWQRNFTGSIAATSALAAVPEPDGALIALGAFACMTLGWTVRRRGRSAYAVANYAGVAALCLTSVGAAQAAVTPDRLYRMGDEPGEGAVINNAVTVTWDSQGVPMTSTLHDLGAGATGSPTYVDVSSGPLARAGAEQFGVQFNGVDDYLVAARLGNPSTTASSTGATPTPGTLDYTSLRNRGFQLWVRPESGGLEDQSVVRDTDDHGVMIEADGATAPRTWRMRYDEATVNSGVEVVYDQWHHVMVVRPYGAAAPSGGSILYLNGVAIAADPGDYGVSAATNEDILNVGANLGETPGAFFKGTLDQLEMFVMGTTSNGLDRGTFNFGADNDYAASVLTGVAGDVDQDNDVDDQDVADFIGGWLTENLVNNVRAGDINTVRDGDLNFDGITDLVDAFALHQALLANGLPGLNFAALGVPEPAALSLGAWCVALGAMVRRSSKSR